MSCQSRVALFQELRDLCSKSDREQKTDAHATELANAINNSGLDQETVSKILAQAVKVSVDMVCPDIVGNFAKISNPTNAEINEFLAKLDATTSKISE